jgi:cold shock CspA family protein
MSENNNNARPESQRKRNFRRRRFQGPGKPRKNNSANNNNAPAEAAAPAPAPKPATESAPRERRPRPTPAPVPEDMHGKKHVGVVSVLVRKGKFNFGFITVGEGENAPQVYFNPSCLAEDNKVYMRRGYEVEFMCSKDSEGRSTAQDIRLTANGEATKAERDAAYQAKRAERTAAPAAAATPAEATPAPATENNGQRRGKKFLRKPRVRGTPVTVNVACHGKEGEKAIDIHTQINIGRLKGLAITAFGAPTNYSVYHVSADGSHVFLNRDILAKLTSNDKLYLGEPKESTA